MYLFIYYDKYIKFSDIAEKYKTREGRLSNIFFSTTESIPDMFIFMKKGKEFIF